MQYTSVLFSATTPLPEERDYKKKKQQPKNKLIDERRLKIPIVSKIPVISVKYLSLKRLPFGNTYI